MGDVDPFHLEVQIWPACRRNLSMYRYGGAPMPREDLEVRGVPAAMLDNGDGTGRLELYTGEVTVVIFGDSRDRVEKAAHGLRAVGGVASRAGVAEASASLPAPAAGAVAGRLSCGP